MSLSAFIGAKLFYLGLRMQPLRIRRAISLILHVGMKWSEKNDDFLARIMNGEHLELGMDFTTREIDPSQHPSQERQP